MCSNPSDSPNNNRWLSDRQSTNCGRMTAAPRATVEDGHAIRQ